MPVKHNYVSTNGDPADPTLIGQTKWNDTHDLTGLNTSEVAPSTDRNYVTDAKLTVLNNTSGTNTGDQTITLTGDVTGSGTGSFATTLASSGVTAGTYGSSTKSAVVTVNAKGLVTGVTEATISGGSGAPQTALSQWFRARPASGTTIMTQSGGSLTSAGTISTPAITGGSYLNRWLRSRYTGSTAAGSAAGVWNNSQMAPTACNPTTEIVWTLNSDSAGYQCMVGVRANTGVIAGDPSSFTNTILIGYDAADALPGNWQLIYNGTGTATKVDTGIPRSTTALFYVKMVCSSNGAQWDVSFQDLTNSTSFTSGALTTGIPGNNQVMANHCSMRNGALTTAAIMDVMAIDMYWTPR